MTLAPLNVEDSPAALATASPTSTEALASSLLNEDDVREKVAMHAAITLLPVSATITTREQVRSNWSAALSVVLVESRPEWALAFLPGTHVGDGHVQAVHRVTGHVFGGDHSATAQLDDETTDGWLDRLTVEFDHHVATHQPGYVHYTDLA